MGRGSHGDDPRGDTPVCAPDAEGDADESEGDADESGPRPWGRGTRTTLGMARLRPLRRDRHARWRFAQAAAWRQRWGRLSGLCLRPKRRVEQPRQVL